MTDHEALESLHTVLWFMFCTEIEGFWVTTIGNVVSKVKPE